MCERLVELSLGCALHHRSSEAAETTRLALELIDADGIQRDEPVVLAFDTVADRAPTATIAEPVQDESIVADAKIEMRAETRDDIPPLFESIVRELLEKDPLDRPQSMASVASRMRDPAMRSLTATRSSPPTGIRITLPPPPMRAAR